ncbi:trypsin [Manduca sexta]|uniref:trypsin n=1 Tax=Manduca sexta TaxID=7130 RepID=UPI0018907D7F|nr:trypsin [Manduca sexta]
MQSKHIFMNYLLFILILFGFLTLSNCAGQNVKKRERLSVDENRDENGDNNDESKDESLDIPVENEPANVSCTRRQNSQLHEIRTARYKQFPFMAAIMSHQNEYLCSGTVVSNGLILTTAQCTQKPISYVLINATKARKDDTTVSLHIIKTEKFPSFTGGDTLKDVALIHTEKHNNTVASKIRLSNFTNVKNVIDCEALGFGLNSEVGQTKDLQYVGLDNRSAFEFGDLIRGYFDCVDTKVPTCFRDTGGPVIYDNELMGIVIKGQDECTKEITSTYAVNKKMADIIPTYTFKAWLDDKIKKNEEMELVSLATYPSKPVAKVAVQKITKAAGYTTSKNIIIIVVCSVSNIYF